MQDERLQELMQKLQGRFKQVASMMGCLQDYFPKATDPEGGKGAVAGPITAGAINF